MPPNSNVVPLFPKPRTARTLIPIKIQIDPRNRQNCFISHYSRHDIEGCPGLTTIGCSKQIGCLYFMDDDSTTKTGILMTSNGRPAVWGARAIRRHINCRIGTTLFARDFSADE